MPEFIVRFYARSAVRLGTKSYDDEVSRRTWFLTLPHAHIAVFDALRHATDEIRIPDGLIIQVKMESATIEDSILHGIGVTSHALSMMSCVTMASIETPRPVWAYDATTGVENREFRYCYYDGIGPRATRPLNEHHLIHLLEKNYTSFLTDDNIKQDFKVRVQRSLMDFRRGLSDNDDVLNEFLTAWSTMEGLDCVYTRLLPASTVREFKDGMKDVLKRLGKPDLFTRLENLRNEIAHGNLSMADATKTANEHLDLIRRALLLMILRILKGDETTISKITAQTPYKGQFPPHIRLLATIQFDPVEVQDLDGQPAVKVWLEGAEFIKDKESLMYQPDIRYKPQNIKHMSAYGLEFWGESGAPICVNNLGVSTNLSSADSGE